MSQSVTDTQATKIRRIIALLQQLPEAEAEQLIEAWMWEVDRIWRSEGICAEVHASQTLIDNGHRKD